MKVKRLCDLIELAGEHGLKVMEDCAQCHGATYKGLPAGSLGDVAAFSFCQDKIMTTGGFSQIQALRPAERLAVARELGETSLMFLVHPTLCDEDMRDTVRAVEKVMRGLV
jgi:dTDP-4-amino-4,6-dideoxygalactose transaminase